MFFTGSTVAGTPGRANEDWLGVAGRTLIVLDGATARTDTGCVHGIDWYAAKLGGHIAGARSSLPLVEVLADAIGHVAALHPECDLTHPGTPSAAVGIVRCERDMLRWCVLGDVTVVLDLGDGQPLVISDDRVSRTAAAERTEVDRYPIGDPRKADALIPMKHAELAARNQPGGYWIAATDPDAVNEAITGEVPAANVRRLAVLTDGAARAVTTFGICDWADLLLLLALDGPDHLIDLVREAEAADAAGITHPRNKTSDDATAVYAQPERIAMAATINRPVNADIPQSMDAVNGLLAQFQNAPGLMGDQIRPDRKTRHAAKGEPATATEAAR